MNDRGNAPQGGSPTQEERRVRLARGAAVAVVVLATSVSAVWLVRSDGAFPGQVPAIEIAPGESQSRLKAGHVASSEIDGTRINSQMVVSGGVAGGWAPSAKAQVVPPAGDAELAEPAVTDRSQNGDQQQMTVDSPVVWLLLVAVLYGVWLVASRRARGLSGLPRTDHSRDSAVRAAAASVTFADVGGVDEAIAELDEIIQFLRAPEKYASLGGRVPKGVLLFGPPGTGKTLLARATASEARVAFFQAGGSEFMEMYVGVGAARVRSLFEQARRAAPAVVFIDEIDSIGQTRSGTGSVHSGAIDEREQTLNQLLAEIDGFRTDPKKPVIIMAATNRPEVLDPALMRAGRFDRQIAVAQPDLAGRLQVLKIHSRGVKLAGEFDLERAARITSGLSGADIENTMNEAALLAARRDAGAVQMEDFEAALERSVAGLERKTRVMNEQERQTVAYHESGHALVAGLVPHADPVSKISIVPRGRAALGYTLQMPSEDRYLMSEEELLDRIAVIMGGRAAEQVTFGTATTGASDDIMKASDLARRMVSEFGMSEALGTVRYAGRDLQFLDGAFQDSAAVSQKTRELIDCEVQRLVREQYQRAQGLLRGHSAALLYLAEQLLEYESLDGAAVQCALAATTSTT